jgi:hypothetical protein
VGERVRQAMGSLIFSGRRAVQRLALWLGLVALTIQGLVPLCVASAAPSGAAGVSSIVICTVHGYETIQLDATGNPVPGAPSSDHGTTCFFCLGCHMGVGFVAPTLAQFSLPAGFEREAPRLVSAITPSRPLHLSYVTRAPPAVSDPIKA